MLLTARNSKTSGGPSSGHLPRRFARMRAASRKFRFSNSACLVLLLGLPPIGMAGWRQLVQADRLTDVHHAGSARPADLQSGIQMSVRSSCQQQSGFGMLGSILDAIV